MAERRLARVFVWKEGTPPDPDYVQQVLLAAVPQAHMADPVPAVSSATVEEWPGDFWAYALPRLREETDWTNPARYELAGWTGRDSRTGARLFVASVYERPPPAPTLLAYGAPLSAHPLGQSGAGPGPPGDVVYPPLPGYPPVAPLHRPPPALAPLPPAPPPALAPVRPGYLLPAYTPPADAYPNQTGISAAELGTNPYGGFYVGFGPRFVAGVVDGVLLAMLELMLVLITVLINRRLGNSLDDPGALQTLAGCLGALLGLVVLIVYLADFWAWRGQTPGMMMMGIQVVTGQGGRPRLGRALLRALGWVMSLLTLGVGFLLILGDERKQGLQDRIANTFVVPVPLPDEPWPADLLGYPPPVTARTPGPAAVSPPPAPAPAAASPWRAPAPPHPPPAPAPAPTLLTALENAVDEPDPGTLGLAPGDPAAAQFRRGLALLAEGAREPGGDRPLLIVEPEAGQAATAAFHAAATVAPGVALYRYFAGVAHRYGEGYGAARPEFEQAQQMDPAAWEIQMQLFFGARWHDAFAYPAWSARAGALPSVLRALLPGRPGSRLVLVREGAARTVAVLIQTQRASWKRPPTADMPARIEVLPAQTPAGLIVALYVALRDDPQNPYRGETFLNPAEVPGPADDATQLGQNLLLQLARQAHTYLIFVDETGAVLLNRLLVFDPATRQNLGQAIPAVQAAAFQATEREQPMPLAAFQEAARWHMQQFPLERVRV